MKKNHIKCILILIILFIKVNIANSQVITSLQLNPMAPTTLDNIKVVAKSFYYSYGCMFNSSSINISGNLINITTKHTVGFLSSVCYATDTIQIGLLSSGTYTLIFTLKDNNTLLTYDTDTLFFNISAPTKIAELSNSIKSLLIFPNPTKSFFYIENDHLNSNLDLFIYNAYGQKIKSLVQFNTKLPIDISDLEPGAYFILSIYDNINHHWTKLIKNAP